MLRNHFLSIVIIACLIVILRIPSLEEPFDNDSSAVAYSARLITRGEPLYSTHHPGHHLPGIYYTYALIFKLLGDRFLSVKFVLIPWTIATAVMVYWVGCQLQGKKVGLISTVIFCVLSSHLRLKGTTGESEMFAILPYAVTLSTGIWLIQRKAPGRHFFLPGVFGGLTFLYKVIFLAPSAAVAGMVLLDYWKNRDQFGEGRIFFERLLSFTAGLGSVFLLVTGYFASQGLLGRFVMVFQAGSGYIDLTEQKPFFYIFIIGIIILAFNNVMVLLLGFVGTTRMIRRIRSKPALERTFSIPALGVLIWFVISLLAAGITRYGYPHYGLIVIPALSIIAGWELAQLVTGSEGAGKVKLQRILFAALALLAVVNSVFSNWDLYTSYISYRMGTNTYANYLAEGTIEGDIYTRNQELADYIMTRTTKEDRIYHWTDYPQIYYLSDRLAPIDMIWPIQTELTGSYERIFSRQTKYIIVGASLYLSEPAWMQAELDKAYQLDTIIDGQRVYRRKED